MVCFTDGGSPFLTHLLIIALQHKEKDGFNTLRVNTLLAPASRTTSWALALAKQAVVTKDLEVAVNRTRNQLVRKTRKITMISRATTVAGRLETMTKLGRTARLGATRAIPAPVTPPGEIATRPTATRRPLPQAGAIMREIPLNPAGATRPGPKQQPTLTTTAVAIKLTKLGVGVIMGAAVRAIAAETNKTMTGTTTTTRNRTRTSLAVQSPSPSRRSLHQQPKRAK